MDYEFRRNNFDGSFYCEFSMGHEAVGRWLLDEIGTDKFALNQAIENIEKVINSKGEWQRKGHSFHLWLDHNEAIIKANSLFETNELELDEGLDNTYDQESIAACGPEDLLAVLLAWQDFINTYPTREFNF